MRADKSFNSAKVRLLPPPARAVWCGFFFATVQIRASRLLHAAEVAGALAAEADRYEGCAQNKPEAEAPEDFLSKIFWVFDVSCGIHASKSWVMGAPIR